MTFGFGFGFPRSNLSGGFSPASLFAAGEPGAWYDPSDLTTMFQDRAGSTPVTAPGQSVGLRLDKSRGLVLGPELVVNGDFSNPVTTGWVAGFSTLSVVNGRIRATGTDSAHDAEMKYSITGLVVGHSYRFTAFISPGTRGVVRMAPSTGFNGPGISRFVDTTASIVIVATSTTGSILIRTEFACPIGQFIEADNISVRELPGNHLTAINDASRGTYGIEPLGGRRNLLTFTEQFDNAAWDKTNLTVNQVSGSQWRFTEAVTTGRKFLNFPGIGLVGGRLSIEAKPNGRNFISIGATNGSGVWSVWLFNVATGQSVGGFEAAAVPVPSNPTITATDNGFYRCSVTVTTNDRPVVQIGNGGNPIFEGYQGDGTSGLIVRQPQFEVGSTATAYQRVGTAFDVTQAGVPSLSYVSYDGVDDGYVSPTITPGTDKAQVFAGLQANFNGDYSVIESSLSPDINIGSFFVYSGMFYASSYAARFSGTILTSSVAIDPPPFVFPNRSVITATGDISGDLSQLRKNGVLGTISTQDRGTGNFLAYPLYVGRRGNGAFPFNGRDYGIIVRFGANLSTATIVQTESFLNQKTGAY